MDNREHSSETPGQTGGWPFGFRLLPIVDVLSRWPIFLARFEWLKFRQMYRSARGPAAVLIWTNLLWIVPIAVYLQYAQVYARELGLREVQVGYLASLTMASSVVFYLVGGWLTDRLGYLKTILLFDTLSWPLPMIILAAATQAWHFYAAALLAGTMAAVAPGWNALFVTRVPPDRRAAAYGMLQLTLTVPGLVFPLLGGWLVGKFGLEVSMRCIYMATAWLTALGTAVRWAILPPTPPLREATPDPVGSLLDQLGLYYRMVTRPDMRCFMLALLLVNLDMYVGGVFVSMYCMEYLGMPKADYAWVSTAASVVRLAGIMVVVPLVTPANTRRFFVLAAACLGLGSGLYLLLLSGPQARLPLFPEVSVPILPAVIAATICWAIGGAIWGPTIMAQWVNMIPERTRSRVWGAHGAVNQLAGAVAVALVGHVYHLFKPSLLMVFIALEVSATVLFALSPVGTDRSPQAADD